VCKSRGSVASHDQSGWIYRQSSRRKIAGPGRRSLAVCQGRNSRYLNNIVEQDHRAIKRRCASMLGSRPSVRLT
jgi:transposase-like protein